MGGGGVGTRKGEPGGEKMSEGGWGDGLGENAGFIFMTPGASGERGRGGREGGGGRRGMEMDIGAGGGGEGTGGKLGGGGECDGGGGGGGGLAGGGGGGGGTLGGGGGGGDLVGCGGGGGGWVGGGGCCFFIEKDIDGRFDPSIADFIGAAGGGEGGGGSRGGSGSCANPFVTVIDDDGNELEENISCMLLEPSEIVSPLKNGLGERRPRLDSDVPFACPFALLPFNRLRGPVGIFLGAAAVDDELTVLGPATPEPVGDGPPRSALGPFGGAFPDIMGATWRRCYAPQCSQVDDDIRVNAGPVSAFAVAAAFVVVVFTVRKANSRGKHIQTWTFPLTTSIVRIPLPVVGSIIVR